MKTLKNGPYLFVAAIVVVGAWLTGVPLLVLALIAILAFCPLMMVAMMRGDHGSDDRGDDASHHLHDTSRGAPDQANPNMAPLPAQRHTSRHHGSRR